MKNAYLLVPGFQCPVSNVQDSAAYVVPAECNGIRFSVVTYQPTRDRPQFGLILEVWWTDAANRTPVRRGRWESLPRDSWTAEEIADGLPISGHAVGSPPGLVPHDVGPFQFNFEQSPAIQCERAEGCDRAFLRYTILGGNNGSPVYISIVAEPLLNESSMEVG